MIKRDEEGKFIKGTFPIKPFIGKERLGKKHSKETRKKMSEKQIGKYFSEETKKKMSLKKIGYIPWIKGKHHSEEAKRKMSKSHKGKITTWTKGENNWNWKGGITSLRGQIYNHFKYRQWRSDIFQRDNFTCQECGQKGGILNPHHIESFAHILKKYQIATLEEALVCEELWNINNGQTLCKECHKKTNTYLNLNKKNGI